MKFLAGVAGALVGALWLMGCSEPENTSGIVDANKGTDKKPAASAPSAEEAKSTETSAPGKEGVAGPPSPGTATAAAGTGLAKLGPKAVVTKTGLKYEDLVVGTGKEAKEGTHVTVHYTGWLTDGTKFDSSADHGKPFDLDLPGQVISGWNQGIPGMKVGGKRKLVVPAALGYGEQGTPGGPIPPNATLVFEVELLEVQ